MAQKNISKLGFGVKLLNQENVASTSKLAAVGAQWEQASFGSSRASSSSLTLPDSGHEKDSLQTLFPKGPCSYMEYICGNKVVPMSLLFGLMYILYRYLHPLGCVSHFASTLFFVPVFPRTSPGHPTFPSSNPIYPVVRHPGPNNQKV